MNVHSSEITVQFSITVQTFSSPFLPAPSACPLRAPWRPFPGPACVSFAPVFASDSVNVSLRLYLLWTPLDSLLKNAFILHKYIFPSLFVYERAKIGRIGCVKIRRR
jgi:hypothetical protein